MRLPPIPPIAPTSQRIRSTAKIVQSMFVTLSLSEFLARSRARFTASSSATLVPGEFGSKQDRLAVFFERSGAATRGGRVRKKRGHDGGGLHLRPGSSGGGGAAIAGATTARAGGGNTGCGSGEGSAKNAAGATLGGRATERRGRAPTGRGATGAGTTGAAATEAVGVAIAGAGLWATA